jgi:hypothetical protein
MNPPGPIEVHVRVEGVGAIVQDASIQVEAKDRATLWLELDGGIGAGVDDPDLLTFRGYTPQGVPAESYKPTTLTYQRTDGIEVTLHPGQYLVESAPE